MHFGRGDCLFRAVGWNERILTEGDALDYCRKHKIYVVDDVRQPYGRLAYYKGYNFILINPTRCAGMRLWILWHEIAHFMFHHPSTSRFSQSMTRKNDREANHFAAVAMMPRHAIEGRTIDEVAAEHSYPRAVVEIRYRIGQNEGI